MYYIIVTISSLSWMILTLFSTLLMLSTISNPYWILSTKPPKMEVFEDETLQYTPSLGILTKCDRPIGVMRDICTYIAVDGFAAETSIYPLIWKISTFILILCILLMFFTVFASLISCCIQSFFKKSLFTITGFVQCLIGIGFIIAIMLYPMAWGTDRVRRLCGRDSSPFYLGNCSIGSGLYLAIIGTILTFICSCLSVAAEKSTSSNKVENRIRQGYRIICLP